MTGGDYSAAEIVLGVMGGSCNLQLHIAPLTGTGGLGDPLLLTFTPCVGYSHTVEYQSALNPGAPWTALPGAPHNTGSLTVTNLGAQRFFRVRASTP